MSTPENLLRTAETDWESVGPGEDRLAERYTTEIKRLGGLGLTTLGAHLETLPPGTSSCPLHYHLVLEEHLYVLEGVLTVRELRRDATETVEYEVPAGQAVAWPAGTRIAHSIHNRSEAPVRLLVVSDKPSGDVVVYPDSGKVLSTGLQGVGVLLPVDGDVDTHLTAANAKARARNCLRIGTPPAHVSTDHSVPERDLGGTFGRALSRALGARQVFLNVDRVPPGAQTSPLHRHTANEELVLVLSGNPTLRQGAPGAVERLRLQTGDAIHWAPDSPVAHHILNESDQDARLLVVGTDRPEDVCHFVERGVSHVAALRTTGVFHPTSYWAGE